MYVLGSNNNLDCLLQYVSANKLGSGLIYKDEFNYRYSYVAVMFNVFLSLTHNITSLTPSSSSCHLDS